MTDHRRLLYVILNLELVHFYQKSNELKERTSKDVSL